MATWRPWRCLWKLEETIAQSETEAGKLAPTAATTIIIFFFRYNTNRQAGKGVSCQERSQCQETCKTRHEKQTRVEENIPHTKVWASMGGEILQDWHYRKCQLWQQGTLVAQNVAILSWIGTNENIQCWSVERLVTESRKTIKGSVYVGNYIHLNRTCKHSML